MIGRTLSHFKITAKLGEGGMGEVYRAEDTKLGRGVAIKVLPPALTDDTERLARFEREAQVLASLNHPNIAGLHQIEEADGRLLLVMELVEGEDLTERLDRGPAGLEETTAIALQLALGLEAAHDRGVVHRDLKPANIKVTAEGQVKILDFGLAKAWAEAPEGGSPSMSPTLTAQMTQAGVILGTAAYMSPEQAKGLEADKRADIWSFGVVLWEMLTGRRLFAGESISDTLAGVLRDEIDLGDLPNDTPTHLRNLLERCLDRDPRMRLRDIGEARVALEKPTDTRGESRDADHPRGGLPWKVAVPAAIVVAALGGLATWMMVSPSHSKQPGRETLRVALSMPEGRRLPTPSEFPRLDVSVDGTTVAYSAFEKGSQAIYLQRLDSFEVTKVRGSEGGSGPLLSPDGEWVAYFMGNTLYKVRTEGGRAQRIAEGTVWDRDAVWLPNDMIIMGGDADDGIQPGLLSVSSAGGAVRPLTEPGPGETHENPTRLPDGTILFGIQNDSGRHLGRFRPESGTWENLGISGGKGWWLEGGFLLVDDFPSIRAYRFDLASGKTMGPPIDVLPEAGAESLAASSSGTVAYVGQIAGGGSTVVAVDDQGAMSPLPLGTASFRWPRASPDGKRLAIGVQEGDETNERLWVYEIDSGRRTRIGEEQCNGGEPVWSPDSVWLVTSSTGCGLLLHRADGSRPPTVLFDPDFNPWPTDWSRERKQIVFYGNGPDDDDQSIWLLDLEPEPSARLAVGGAGPQRLASFSPDGNFLAYASRESGRNEIYVKPLPDLDRRWTVSAAGGLDPKWAPDGRTIFYRHHDGVYSVPFEPGPDLRLGAPRLLFSGPFAHDPNGDQSWDVLPDGRFVFVLPDTQRSPDLRVVTRLTEEIRQALAN